MTRRTLTVAAVATLAAALLAGPAAATGHAPPHPTPFGPQRPHEPDVNGPDNIDEGSARYRRDGGTRHGVEATFTSKRYTATGVEPAAAREFVFLFDRSVRVNPHRFPTCDAATLTEHGAAACPDGSQVGSGKAVFYRGGEGEVLVFNAKFDHGRRGVLIYIPATGAALPNTFERVVGRYRADYRWGLNEILPVTDTPPEQRPSTSTFTVTFGGVRNGQSYLSSSARPGAELAAGVWSEYVTGQTTLVEGTATRP